ncbi:hypothetical protein Theos_0048 [Thermus oshimai JL-2]|uniref:Helix-turn-helix domain-containing protein n=1 Tax=Thermus oshimai JL-2 TaxID=751945 RepID=K7QV79_THEOS|nr:hypothetical protein [Thermus oshimai]AFV75133.1 hypothetical protein Theos_0048 [Thermus oshimai JL-2]
MNAPKLLTVAELREVLGPDRVGRDLAYAIARRYGVRLGKRLLVPLRVVEAIAEGRMEELEKTPGVEARGR